MNLLSANRRDPSVGLAAALIIFCIYGGMAVSIDFPHAAFGFQSDEATYYLMGHSLVEDHDLAYRREDLVRVWREFPSGPTGVFLKKGRDLDIHFTGTPPFVAVSSTPDPDQGRLFFGKSYVYPLAASPFVWLAGTNGFLLFHAVLMALVLLVAYLFLNARSSPAVSLVLSSGFVMASVAPAYFVWITPEFFNLSLVILAYFCWLYKEVSTPERPIPGTAWLTGPGSDLVAALLLGIATFSKPSNVLLILPMLGAMLLKRQWKRLVVAGAVFAIMGGVLVAGNVVTTGEWNFQGGDRRTFYGQFPFEDQRLQWEGVGKDHVTNRLMTELIFDPRVFGTVFSHNLAYFFVGRHAGILPYFFPGAFALGAFLLARRSRTRWQWLIVAAAAAQSLLLLIWVPYTFNGGGGSVGNRYFINTYGVFLFLLPPIESIAVALIPWVVGALFTANIAFNPFFSSFYPAEAAKHGPLRWLPVELTLVNDLPINTQANRARVWFGEQRRFQIYFLDDNAYAREGLFVWVRGQSTADILVKTVEPASALDLDLAAGEAATTVTVARGWHTERLALAPHEAGRISMPLDEGFPYNGTRVWKLSIRSSGGFVPSFSMPGSADTRYLGVQVKPELRK